MGEHIVWYVVRRSGHYLTKDKTWSSEGRFASLFETRRGAKSAYAWAIKGKDMSPSVTYEVLEAFVTILQSGTIEAA